MLITAEYFIRTVNINCVDNYVDNVYNSQKIKIF